MKIIVFTSCLFFLSLNELFADNDGKAKALWVVRDILKSKSTIDQLLSDARRGNFTDLFVQVRGRGDAFYNSQISPKAEGVANDFDPLAYLIEKAHGQKFKIHAWMNVFYVWSAERDPLNKEHIIFEHPEWSAVSADNVSMVDEGTSRLIAKKYEGIFLSPGDDEFQSYFLKLVAELLDHYQLDGIHLDYIRYPGDQYDYSPGMRSKFMLEYGEDPLKPDNHKNIAQAKDDSDRTVWIKKKWTEFRREELTRFVAKIHGEVKSLKPEVMLTAAVFADLTEARDKVMQDWIIWLQKGFLDLAVMMNYAADQTLFENRIREVKATAGDSIFSKKIWVGVAVYNQNSTLMREKIKTLKKWKPAGLSVFSYEVLRTDRKYFNAVIDPKLWP
ncbi:family 10 glycosylhydrolase [bacterium]|nr:family 10 glycosylhydrolase [bacterium]